MSILKCYPWGAGVTMIALSSCSVVLEEPFREEPPLYEYVKEADLNYDNDTQKLALKKFFDDMIEMAPYQIHAKRWPDDQGIPEQWTAPQVFDRYVHSTTPKMKTVNVDTFYEDLNDMRVKSILVYWVQNLDGNMKG